MAIRCLTEEELMPVLEELPGWSIEVGKLHREYRFPDFAHAMGFMAASAVLIEKINHHPEWFNVYGRIVVDLTTHDSGGITKRDVALARVLENMAVKLMR